MRTLTLVGLLLVAISASFATWETQEIDWYYIYFLPYFPGYIWVTGMYQNSMVLDNNRHPHVAYLKLIDQGQFQIKYCQAYGSFTKELVGTISSDGLTRTDYVPDVALVLDSSGNPHIFVATYINNTDGGSVYHYYKSGGNWVCEPIDFLPNGEQLNPNQTIRISAKQDSQGHFHVIYSMNWLLLGNGYRIRYATNKTGSWVVTDAYWNGGYYPITGCDLEVCTSDWPMISFVEKTAANTMRVRYTWYEEYIDEQSGQLVKIWHPCTVDELTSYGSEINELGETQLEITSDNQPMISYYLPKTSEYDYRFMIALRDSDGDWHKSTIDSSATYVPGVYNSLALKASDEPDVTYSKQGHLWFGIYDGSWDLSCIFETSVSGLYNHLVLDPTDDGWYMTHVCNSSGYSHLFIQWWDPIKSEKGLAWLRS